MKRQTAVRHLVETAALATEGLRFRGSDVGWPLLELWVAGDLLTDARSIENQAVVMVLDMPPEQLPWLARHPAGEWVGDHLRLPKRPMSWYYRPAARPVWNHQNRRLVRFWSADGGTDEDAVDGLRMPSRDPSGVVAPSTEELATQLRTELRVSERHLRETVDRYWDREWRRQHSGYDTSPDEHLWRAAAAVTEMQEALEHIADLAD